MIPRDAHPLAGKRIIQVYGWLKLGGAERQGLLVARYLKEVAGADVHVWGMSCPERVAELCERDGIPWKIVACAQGGRLVRRLQGLVKFAWAVRSARPDVLMPYTLPSNPVCGTIWRLTGARTCIWNQREAGWLFPVHPLMRAASRLTPCFISNSAHAAAFLERELKAPPDRIHVVRNGVELAPPAEDRETWRRRLGVAEDALVACMVANLTIYKDHLTLLKAWRLVVDRLSSRGRRAVLVLAGRFEETHAALEQLGAELGLRQSLAFLGGVADISGLLRAVDLGVFSSRSEGCPNGILECMAAGLAVVATEIPGIREAVGPDGDRFLAPPGDAGALATQIVRLALKPELRAQVGELSRGRIQAEFSPSQSCRKTSEIISGQL